MPPSLPAAKSPDYASAALIMILSVTLFTVSHGFVRAVGADIHPFEIAFATSLFSFMFYLPWLARTRFRPLRTGKIRVHWARAALNVTAICGWYTALSMTPLADAVALALTGPLVTTLGAVLFLGEAARARRWVALGIGICGALLIIRPGFQSFSPGYGFVFIAVVCGAGSRLITKHLTTTEDSAPVGAWLALLQVPITFLLAIFVWSWPSLTQLGLMIAIGLLVGGAHYTMTVAFSRTEVGALEPFNFTRLIIAALIGYFVFSEFPDAWTWAGGLVIVAASTYIAHREAVRRRQQTSA